MLLTLIAIAVVSMFDRIPQNPSYHSFADHRSIIGVPNFFNVLSNLPFLIIGIYGLSILKRSNTTSSIKLMYATLFMGIAFTGLGSAYYHYNPDNASLVLDRIPMTIVFMSFLSVAVAECVNKKAGKYLLLPLILTGIVSVLWWHHSETIGKGDLRFYGFIQFYPILLIPLMFLLFPSPIYQKGLHSFLRIIGWYMIAKIFEYFDDEIYSFTGIIAAIH